MEMKYPLDWHTIQTDGGDMEALCIQTHNRAINTFHAANESEAALFILLP